MSAVVNTANRWKLKIYTASAPVPAPHNPMLTISFELYSFGSTPLDTAVETSKSGIIAIAFTSGAQPNLMK